MNDFEFGSLPEEIEKIKSDLDTRKNKESEIIKKYQKDVFDILIEFDNHKDLNTYIHNSFFINRRSKDIEGSNIFMDHILFNFMKQHILSLLNLVNYKLTKDKPIDLESSYVKSIEIANQLKNKDGSLAWYINQRIPTTYVKANSVKYHLENIFAIFCAKKEVDVRRIHLFYEKFFVYDEMKPFGYLNTKALFTTLLLEYLHGIASKVLVIKNYDNVKQYLFRKGEEISLNSLFLLDFALYFSKDNYLYPEKNYLYGKSHILCADFVAEDPHYKEDDNGQDAIKREFDLRTESYEKDKVYVFKNNIIYSLFQNYFLSMWNKEEYFHFMDLHLKEQNANHELIELNDILKNEIQVIDFLDFWKEAMGSTTIDNLFDTNIFSAKYSWNSPKIAGKNKKQSLKKILEIITEFEPKENEKNNWEKLDNELNDFRLRDIKTSNQYKH